MRRPDRRAVPLACFLALAAPALSGGELPPGALLVCDSSEDRVLRLEDRDGSGVFEAESAGEVAVFYDPSGGGPELSVPSHLATDREGRVVLLDGGTLDAVLVLEDLDGDGDALGGEEVRVFYDAAGDGPALATPDTLIALPDGSFLVSDDGSRARRILRLEDFNGDGDAQDDGEAVEVYAADVAPGPAPGDIESLAYGEDGTLYAGDSTEQTVYALEDQDGDGAYLAPGEVRVFHAATKDLPLPDLDALQVVGPGEVLAVDEDEALILHLQDLDGDGMAAGSGEVTVVLDATAAQRVRDLNDVGLLDDGSLLLVDGREDTVFLAQDLDGDGDVLEEDEVQRLLLDGGESLATPSGVVFLPEEEEPPPPAGEFVRADANGDGGIDISDAVAVLEYLFLAGTGHPCPDILDVDDSGVVNISDPIRVLNWLFLGGPDPEPPFPEPGPDPTDDALPCDAS